MLEQHLKNWREIKSILSPLLSPSNLPKVRAAHLKKLRCSAVANWSPTTFPLALRSGCVCVHLHGINALMLLHVAMCETLLLIPAMSQAVPPSEAYGEKVTSCFILISIITLWRASSYCCHSPSEARPPHDSVVFCPAPPRLVGN